MAFLCFNIQTFHAFAGYGTILCMKKMHTETIVAATRNKNKIKEINNIYYETKKDSIKNTIKDIKGELKNSCYCKFCEKKT